MNFIQPNPTNGMLLLSIPAQQKLGLDGHFIKTENCISEANVKQAIEILQREDGPFLLDDTLHTPELKAWREKYT